jgi:hypothetical protein
MGEEADQISDPRDYRNVEDGGTLKTLDNGLVIVRRKKHEPLDMGQMSRTEIIRRTSKISGSKFNSRWTLENYVNWVAAQTLRLGWSVTPGDSNEAVRLSECVGVSNGQNAYTIRLRRNGRYVHAYPEV